MNTRIRTVARWIVLAASVASPSLVHAQATWGGYLQTRFSSDFQSSTGFSVRRAKLYATSIAPFDTNLSGRMQAIFRWQNAGTFTLQDVYAEYRLADISVRAGQFVPGFSLQRLQPDAAMPVVERALAVDALTPAAETYARDIGAEFTVRPIADVQVSVGAFNGNGGNQCMNNDRQLLYVARPALSLMLSDSLRFHVGMSFSYRDKSGLIFKKIFGTSVPFTGKDVRWGGELEISSSLWSLQSEYLEAHLGAQKAYGYYVLGTVSPCRTNEIVGLVEQFVDLDPKSSNAAWYGLGWNHFFAANRFKTQGVVRAQFLPGANQYAFTLQVQLFIH